jgi:gliding motility-associated-like protein
VTVTTQAPPNAGTNGTLTVCQGTTPTNSQLFAQLGGTPNAGGTWSNSANVYTYTVAATAPCTGNATATVTITPQTPPNAGSNGTLTVCQGTTPTNAQLFAQLGGTPNAGGTWSNVANVYTYTVAATVPCTGNATATVTITTQAPPNAGNNGTLTVCQGTTPTNVQLFAQLGGAPNAGGTWSNSANVYTYTVAATAPCTGNATATVTVTTQAPPNAGNNGTLTICQGTTPTNAQLFAQLGGTPKAGGTWSNSANVYTYTVPATAPCTGNATATVTVTTQSLPIVGITGNTALSVGSTISLIPSTGGTWISSNSGIATVTNGGLVTGVAIGQVSFTFNAINGCSNTTGSVIVSPSILPIVSIADAVTVEGGNIVFAVDLSKAYEFDIILTFAYRNGTTADSDYTKTVTLVIPAGTTSTTLTIASLEDSIDELDETFTLSISTCNIIGIGISDTAIGTILNNDIDAINDVFMPIDGGKGGVTPSLLLNDTIGTKPIVTSEVTLTSLPLPTGLTLQPNGTIIVAPGTPAGTYPVTYTICQVSNPQICDTAVSNVIVTETTIVANDDDFTSIGINGSVGGIIGNIFDSNGIDKDMLRQIQVSAATVTTTILNNGGLVGLVISPNGDLKIPAGTAAGMYTIDYRICEQGNLNNCDVAKITLLVKEPIIEAMVDDYKTPINSAIGGEIKNIISNDLLNGQPVVSSNVNISLVNPSLNLYNFTVDNNGNFSIPEGLPKGSYRVEYQICEKLNPTNCTTSFVLFEVLDPCDFDDSPSSCDLIVHNAISPDDNNYNKVFIIEGIEKYANNKVEIYNRWGVIVYQVEGYDNNQRSFTGFSDGRSTVKQIEKLPEGTYYYTIQYVKNNGLTKKVAGFLLIER